MKNFKFLSSLLVATILIVGLNSCGKKSDGPIDYIKKIEGSWEGANYAIKFSSAGKTFVEFVDNQIYSGKLLADNNTITLNYNQSTTLKPRPDVVYSIIKHDDKSLILSKNQSGAPLALGVIKTAPPSIIGVWETGKDANLEQYVFFNTGQCVQLKGHLEDHGVYDHQGNTLTIRPIIASDDKKPLVFKIIDHTTDNVVLRNQEDTDDIRSLKRRI